MGTTANTEHPAAAYHRRLKAANRAKICATSLQILTSEGLGALTVERVAAESGIAKTTIYRMYPSDDGSVQTMALDALFTESEESFNAAADAVIDITALVRQRAEADGADADVAYARMEVLLKLAAHDIATQREADRG